MRNASRRQQFQRLPQRRVEIVGEFGTDREHLMPKFRIPQVIVEAQSGLIGGGITSQAFRRDPRLAAIAPLQGVPPRLQEVSPAEIAVLAGPVNRVLLGAWAGIGPSPLGSVDHDRMAEPAGTMDVLRVAGIDPETQPVSERSSRPPCNGALLPFNLPGNCEAPGVPGQPDVGERLPVPQ